MRTATPGGPGTRSAQWVRWADRSRTVHLVAAAVMGQLAALPRPRRPVVLRGDHVSVGPPPHGHTVADQPRLPVLITEPCPGASKVDERDRAVPTSQLFYPAAHDNLILRAVVDQRLELSPRGRVGIRQRLGRRLTELRRRDGLGCLPVARRGQHQAKHVRHRLGVIRPAGRGAPGEHVGIAGVGRGAAHVAQCRTGEPEMHVR